MRDLASDMNQNMAKFACEQAGQTLSDLGYQSFAVVVVSKADQHVTCALTQHGDLVGMADAMTDAVADWAGKHIGASLPEPPADSLQA